MKKYPNVLQHQYAVVKARVKNQKESKLASAKCAPAAKLFVIDINKIYS